ncbi:MAG: peptidase M14 [Turneriella sp.]|nr:peptidase M14 [Turneriella sp.]
MFRVFSFFGVVFLSVFFCRSEVKAPAQIDESAISDEIQESKTRKPYLVPAAMVSVFREKYQARFGMQPTLTLQKDDVSVFLLNAGEHKDAVFNGIKINEARSYPPFIYFDPTYATRLERGYTALEDLQAGYKDPMLNEALLAGVVKAYPRFTKLHIIGTTALGRNLLALELSDFKAREKKIPLLFSGAMHGNELTATEHCYHIISEILKNTGNYSEILSHHSLWIIPIANPDGNHFFWHVSSLMGRKNASIGPGQTHASPMRGVDLNRNFPFRWNSGHKKASSEDPNSVYYRGPSPGSEKETQAIMQLAERERFLFAISFHAVSGKILIPYTIENTRNPSPDYAGAFAREIAPQVRHHNPRRGFRAVKYIYPVDGTDQDYLYFQYGTIAYIVESSYRNSEYRYVPYFLEGYQPLWSGMLNDYGANYKFALRVKNARGEPVRAAVKFSDLTFFEGEKHATNPGDGSFFRLTKNGDPVEVTISAAGYKPYRAEIAPHGVGYPALTEISLEAN